MNGDEIQLNIPKQTDPDEVFEFPKVLGEELEKKVDYKSHKINIGNLKDKGVVLCEVKPSCFETSLLSLYLSESGELPIAR